MNRLIYFERTDIGNFSLLNLYEKEKSTIENLIYHTEISVVKVIGTEIMVKR